MMGETLMISEETEAEGEEDEENEDGGRGMTVSVAAVSTPPIAMTPPVAWAWVPAPGPTLVLDFELQVELDAGEAGPGTYTIPLPLLFVAGVEAGTEIEIGDPESEEGATDPEPALNVKTEAEAETETEAAELYPPKAVGTETGFKVFVTAHPDSVTCDGLWLRRKSIISSGSDVAVASGQTVVYSGIVSVVTVTPPNPPFSSVEVRMRGGEDRCGDEKKFHGSASIESNKLSYLFKPIIVVGTRVLGHVVRRHMTQAKEDKRHVLRQLSFFFFNQINAYLNSLPSGLYRTFLHLLNGDLRRDSKRSQASHPYSLLDSQSSYQYPSLLSTSFLRPFLYFDSIPTTAPKEEWLRDCAALLGFDDKLGRALIKVLFLSS
ncbi:hypothetical protein G7Y89_g9569 [Cudoniella acicularis]|uniref:Uncharacterized protein n=1 Tax=Cudoniella acicularis TaxID=354080 RepID=A0A8H4VZZ9_9HELO|nr:hypothetical protein G7Y89_g9569 [Cudoniella acicularis]